MTAFCMPSDVTCWFGSIYSRHKPYIQTNYDVVVHTAPSCLHSAVHNCVGKLY